VAEAKEVPCAFCGSSIVGGDFVLCSKCDVPAHRECWATNGRCPAYACGSTEPMEPAVAIYRRQKREPAVSAPLEEVGFSRPPSNESDLESRISTIERQLGSMRREFNRRALRIIAISVPLAIMIIATEGNPVLFVMSVLVMAVTVAAIGRSGGQQSARLMQALEQRLEALKIQQIEETAGFTRGESKGQRSD
jgi:hypothetical protein